jgi:hypothetical protein
MHQAVILVAGEAGGDRSRVHIYICVCVYITIRIRAPGETALDLLAHWDERRSPLLYHGMPGSMLSRESGRAIDYITSHYINLREVCEQTYGGEGRMC